MAKQLSQTALYGELLTNEGQYDREVSILRVTHEEQQALIERARCGDEEAKHAIITSVLFSLSRIAKRYVATYWWSSSHLEYFDLVQDASIALLINIDDALKKEEPISYLVGIGRGTIRQACSNAASTGCCVSLDAPLKEDGEGVLHETLPSSLLPTSPYTHETRDHTVLYQAIEQLPVPQKTVILRCYSIHEHEQECCADVNRSMGLDSRHHRAYMQERAALATLHLHLKSSYPEYTTSVLQLSHNATSSDTQRHLLDAAYEEIKTSGRKVTVRALRAKVKAKTNSIMFYLRERKQQSA